jgi:hypothetical protein
MNKVKCITCNDNNMILISSAPQIYTACHCETLLILPEVDVSNSLTEISLLRKQIRRVLVEHKYDILANK